MAPHNQDIAQRFQEMADLLSIQGANPFRVRAYAQAAQTIAGHGDSVAEMDASERKELPGIGADLAQKIDEIVGTGDMAELSELRRQVPPQLRELLNIPGLGPKRVKALFDQLGITDQAALKAAASKGEIAALSGFGKKTEQGILEALAQSRQKRFKLAEVEPLVTELLAYLENLPGAEQVTVAGSYRRRKETVGDIDLVMTGKTHADLIQGFEQYDRVKEVLASGSTRCSVRLDTGLQVDLRLVDPKSHGAALHYFTGSRSHVVTLRKMAQDQGIKVNEYGLFAADKPIAGETESEVYQALGLAYVAPELRENQGEIEAAQNGGLPALVRESDIRGDLHVHTNATDGLHSLEQMAGAAQKRGYAYLAITDHSQQVKIANGMDEKRLAKQMEAIDALNETLDGLTLLKGVEVDIREDGSLDLADSILKQLDICVCSVHFHFKRSRKAQTRRILKAMEHPCFNILAHPTGRMIHEREPYELDLKPIMAQAADQGIHLELNSHPKRLDLDDRNCMLAKSLGVKIAVSTDAHRREGLDNIRFGIGQARRGWLEKADLLNTRSLSELRNALKRK